MKLQGRSVDALSRRGLTETLGSVIRRLKIGFTVVEQWLPVAALRSGDRQIEHGGCFFRQEGTPDATYLRDSDGHCVVELSTIPGIRSSHFVHDGADHLLVEATTTGNLTCAYIWLEDLPLAMVTDADTVSPRLYWLHTDHFGAQEKATDAAAALAWNAVTTPFGVHTHLSGGADYFESAQAGL